MKYGTGNLIAAVGRALANASKAYGYNIVWQDTGEVEVQTSALSSPRGQVTIVTTTPTQSSYFVRLNEGSTPKDEEIPIPAFAIRIPQGPVKQDRYGLGHTEFWQERIVFIHGFVLDEYQQRELADFFTSWLDQGNGKISVTDYLSDPDNPAPLEPVDVWKVYVETEQWIHEVEAVRYYIKVTAVLRYVE